MRRRNAASKNTMLSPAGTRGRPTKTPATSARPTPISDRPQDLPNLAGLQRFGGIAEGRIEQPGQQDRAERKGRPQPNEVGGHSAAASGGGASRRARKWVISKAVPMEERVASVAAQSASRTAPSTRAWPARRRSTADRRGSTRARRRGRASSRRGARRSPRARRWSGTRRPSPADDWRRRPVPDHRRARGLAAGRSPSPPRWHSRPAFDRQRRWPSEQQFAGGWAATLHLSSIGTAFVMTHFLARLDAPPPDAAAQCPPSLVRLWPAVALGAILLPWLLYPTFGRFHQGAGVRQDLGRPVAGADRRRPRFGSQGSRLATAASSGGRQHRVL